jgi:hypothetical protein
MNAPKYPRVIVKGARHIKLSREAKKRGMSIEAVAEEKLKIADKAVKN